MEVQKNLNWFNEELNTHLYNLSNFSCSTTSLKSAGTCQAINHPLSCKPLPESKSSPLHPRRPATHIHKIQYEKPLCRRHGVEVPLSGPNLVVFEFQMSARKQIVSEYFKNFFLPGRNVNRLFSRDCFSNFALRGMWFRFFLPSFKYIEKINGIIKSCSGSISINSYKSCKSYSHKQ